MRIWFKILVYKTKYVVDAEDKINSITGKWCQSYEIGDTLHYTRSGRLWNCLNGRLRKNIGGAYADCSNGFKDFHTFSEWVQSQPGYRQKDEGGRNWTLDKDLLIPGNRIYCEDRCCLVPQKVNNLFIYSLSQRTGLPMGVSWQEERGKYASYITENGKRKFLGRYPDPMSAHNAWKLAKIGQIENALDTYPQMGENVKAVLRQRIDELRVSIENNEITFLKVGHK